MGQQERSEADAVTTTRRVKIADSGVTALKVLVWEGSQPLGIHPVEHDPDGSAWVLLPGVAEEVSDGTE